MTVWRVDLAGATDDGLSDTRVLSADERARVESRRSERDRRRLLRAHVGLRLALAEATGENPAGLVFTRGPHGRPELDGRDAHDVRFSLSHSRDLALIAIVRGRSVGVDVESVAPIADLDGAAAVGLGERERRRLAAMPENRRVRAFLERWTLKEARLKADGRGLTADPGTVPLPPVGAGHDRSWQDGRWSWRTLVPAPEYVGAVVVEAGAFEIDLRDYLVGVTV